MSKLNTIATAGTYTEWASVQFSSVHNKPTSPEWSGHLYAGWCATLDLSGSICTSGCTSPYV